MLQLAPGLTDPKRPATLEACDPVARQIEVLCGAVMLLCLLSTYSGGYERLIGHAQRLAVSLDAGFLSLQMFFAIAAYQLVRELSADCDLARYAAARFLRFLPAVVPAVLIAYAAVRAADLPQLHADLAMLPANLAMMADFVGLPDFDGAFWRLKIELMFAAWLGLLWFALSPRAAIAVLLTGLTLCALQAHGNLAHPNVLTPAGLLTLDGYLPNLVLGVAMFHLAAREHRALWWLLAAMAAAIVLASNTPVHGAMVLASYGLIWAAAQGRLAGAARLGWLAAIGRAFFCIFLLHQTLGFAAIHALEAHGIAPLPALLAASALVILCGAALHHLVARPAQQHAPRLLARLAERSGSAVAETGYASVLAAE